jgi:hypothetical protein
MVVKEQTNCIQRRYNSMALGEQYFHGANIILAHFHHLCNGTSPFLLDPAEDGTRRVAGLHDQQSQFLDKIQHLVRSESKFRTAYRLRVTHNRTEQRVKSLRADHRYEDELYWSHQLFFKSWVPTEKTIVDEM